jgi:putative ABC transport system permease protein
MPAACGPTPCTGGLPVGLADQVAGMPGVAAASAFVTSDGFFDPGAGDDDGNIDDVPLEGVSAAGVAQTSTFAVTAGSLRDLTGDTMAVAAEFTQPGRQLGDRVRMRLGDNSEVTLRIVAVFGTRPGYGSVLMPASLLAEHTSTGLASEILVRAEPGTDTARLTTELNSLAAAHPGLGIADRATVSAAFATQEQTSVWINYLLVAAIVGYTVIALVNTLVIATAQRRREFALQRLIGSTRGQVVRMMTVEAVLTAIGGIVLGCVVALLTLVPFGLALNGSAVPVGPMWIFLTIIAGGAGLTMLATLVPTWVALRPRPVEAAAVAV